MTDINTPQPPPIPRPDRRPTWELVIEDARQNPHMTERILDDMANRHAFGVAKYGVPLTSGDGRNHLIDAYQESLDLLVYLRQELDERGLSMEDLCGDIDLETKVIMTSYANTMGLVMTLRHLIDGTRPSFPEIV